VEQRYRLARFEAVLGAQGWRIVIAGVGETADDLGRAKRQARRLVDVLSPEQVRAWMGREIHAVRGAAQYRASQLLGRAFGDDGGR
jgi:hypothetical protein